MDRFNVITPTSNLNELELDMNSWSNLPYDIRKRSDEDCLRMFGVTNVDFYNKLKRSIIANQTTVSDNSENIVTNIQTQTEGVLMYDDAFKFEDEETNFDNRKQIANQLETSPEVVIISPIKDDEEMDIKDLQIKYNKFLLLSDKNKRFSNSYSISLWGYDVPNMYTIMSNRILNQQLDDSGEEPNLITDVEESSIEKIDKFLHPVLESIDKKLLEDDKVGLYVSKLDSLADMDTYSKTVYSSVMSNINDCLYKGSYQDTIPNMTPYFTPDEMEALSPINTVGDTIPYEYYRTISEKMKKYNNSTGEEKDILEKEIISLGWNPSVELTFENMKFARNRQIKWLEEHAARIVDISKLNYNRDTILESTANMRNIFKEKNLYPIYIVISYTNTTFGKIINKVKNSVYSHAGISLDSDLSKICTFMWGPGFNGFWTESIDSYIKTSKDAIIDVLAIFVDKNTKHKVEETLKYFITKRDKTKYGFGNLFNILANREVNDPDNMSLVCSQFVATVLKLANINIVDKPTNLVIPQDFEVVNQNPKVFKLYEGKANKYNEKKVEDLLYSLFVAYRITDLQYSETMNEITTLYSVESFYHNTENDKADSILEEVRELLTPQVVIYEKKLPFKITDKGDLEINFAKTLEDQYQEAHKLLTGYTKDNLDGMKHELARLFLVNSMIEKKIKKMKKHDESYKVLIDLRARVLNDFKKYFKIIIEAEPGFNFAKYYEESEYNNSNIVIDNSTLKFSGNLIKNFLKSKGI